MAAPPAGVTMEATATAAARAISSRSPVRMTSLETRPAAALPQAFRLDYGETCPSSRASEGSQPLSRASATRLKMLENAPSPSRRRSSAAAAASAEAKEAGLFPERVR